MGTLEGHLDLARVPDGDVAPKACAGGPDEVGPHQGHKRVDEGDECGREGNRAGRTPAGDHVKGWEGHAQAGSTARR